MVSNRLMVAVLLAAGLVSGCPGGRDDPPPSATPAPPAAGHPGLPAHVADVLTDRIFDLPVGAVAPPGRPGHLLVAERTGLVVDVLGTGADMQVAPILDLRRTIVYGVPRLPVVAKPRAKKPERGLLAIALHPAFPATPRLFVSYVARNDARLLVSRFDLDPATLKADTATETVLLRIELPFGGHPGGALAFTPDGRLLVGVGDGGGVGDPRDLAQDPGFLPGKVLRLDVDTLGMTADFAVPLDNPWRGNRERWPEVIWASGFCDPRAFAVRSNGSVWVANSTGGQGETISPLQPATNYGWGEAGTAGKQHPATLRRRGRRTAPPMPRVKPLVAYGKAGGDDLTGVQLYAGQAWPALRGWLLFCDGTSGRLWRVQPDRREAPALLLTVPGGLAGFGTDANHEPLLLGRDGHLYTLTP